MGHVFQPITQVWSCFLFVKKFSWQKNCLIVWETIHIIWILLHHHKKSFFERASSIFPWCFSIHWYLNHSFWKKLLCPRDTSVKLKMKLVQANIFRGQFISEYFYLTTTLAFLHKLVSIEIEYSDKRTSINKWECVKQVKGTRIVLFALGWSRLELGQMKGAWYCLQLLIQYLTLFKLN